MNTEEIGALLQDKKKLLSEIYFDLQAASDVKYGPDTPVIIEVGTFFEFIFINNIFTYKFGKSFYFHFYYEIREISSYFGTLIHQIYMIHIKKFR